MSWDVAVIGGGLAGAAAACGLARAGRRVVLFEREREAHHKVCGEFVSGEAAQQLDRLDAGGGDAVLLSLGAVPIEQVRLVHGRAQASVPLPFPAWGLSRRRLDSWLLARAGCYGVAVRHGQAVQSMKAQPASVAITTGGQTVTAAAAMLATGKHDLRSHRRHGPPSHFIGFKMHLRLAAARDRELGRQVELVLFPGGYAGLQHVEDGLTNLCLLITTARFARLGRDWHRLILSVPHLARRLDGATACWQRPLAIAGMPYGFVHRGREEAPVYRVGDQVAVIPSFTGDGMAMALRSAELAVTAVLAGRAADAYHAEAVRTLGPPVRLATRVAAASSWAPVRSLLPLVGRLVPGLVTRIARRTRVQLVPV